MPTQKDPTIFGYQNFYSTTLTGDITSGTLTIGLATVPSPTSGILIIEPDSTSAREVILYTSKGASTITCPSDGRGWAGSSASSHLQGSTVIMASVDEYFEGLADGTLSTDPARSILIRDHIVSGGVVAQSAGLVGTFSNIVFYLNAQRYSGTSIANKTYTASKDTYVDVTAISGGTVSVTYSEVTNGAAAPALAANYIRVAKVVTNGSAITSVVQYGQDSLANIIYPTGSVRFSNIEGDSTPIIRLRASTSTSLSTSAVSVNLATVDLLRGTGLSQSGNTIVVGSGVTLVEVSATIIADSMADTYMFSRCRLNRGGNLNEFTSQLGRAASGFTSNAHPPYVLEVQSGDIIDLRVDVGSGTATLSNGRPQWLQVKAIG